MSNYSLQLNTKAAQVAAFVQPRFNNLLTKRDNRFHMHGPEFGLANIDMRGTRDKKGSHRELRGT